MKIKYVFTFIILLFFSIGLKAQNYYLVVSSCDTKSEALLNVDKFSAGGFVKSGFLYNNQKKVYLVYLESFELKKQAEDKLLKYENKFKGIYIYESPKRESTSTSSNIIPAINNNNSIELFNLVSLFSPERSYENTSQMSWETGKNEKLISWLTNTSKINTNDFYKQGKVKVINNGKSIGQLLNPNSSSLWDIYLFGNINGYTNFLLQSPNFKFLSRMSIDELFAGKDFRFQLLEKDNLKDTYLIEFSDRKQIKLFVSWPSDESGYSITIEGILLY